MSCPVCHSTLALRLLASGVAIEEVSKRFNIRLGAINKHLAECVTPNLNQLGVKAKPRPEEALPEPKLDIDLTKLSILPPNERKRLALALIDKMLYDTLVEASQGKEISMKANVLRSVFTMTLEISKELADLEKKMRKERTTLTTLKR